MKRVRKQFAAVESRKQVWIALGTDSKSLALKRAHSVSEDLEQQWLAKLSGGSGDSQKFDALSQVATARGFQYLPADQVALQSIAEILMRLTVAQENDTVAEAVLGSEKKPVYRLSNIVDLYLELVATDVQNKGRDQRRVWENTIRRCVKRLITAIGDKALDELTREELWLFVIIGQPAFR